MSYGRSRAAEVKRVAAYVDRILRGAKPGELPVEQPGVFELVVSASAARSPGLRLPPSVLLRATRVIE